ncbi:hypothetical protein [Bradyrhizobium sp. 192]|uniref:hypothetical protein n=1 Tax=Bradyrhizobium sp. 192 TaxID=2782660 RepID=UPI001FFEE911|nr:hypothetical protein [Bradyrhizobium sp. 192]UPJ57932.1 hypothetical protein IVB24_36295 [Bradyrhizobium sp. 192]
MTDETTTPSAKDDYFIQVAKRYAAKDPRFQATLFSYYSVDPSFKDDLAKLFSGLSVGRKSWHPFGFVIADMKNREVLHLDHRVIAVHPGLNLFADQRKFALPDACYMVLFSPCVAREGFNDYFLAMRTRDVVLGLLASLAGRTICLDHISDQVLVAATLEETSVSNAFRVPHPYEFVAFNDPAILSETLDAILALPEEARDSILFAQNVFGRAVQERDEWFRFSLYWISLEMIAQTKGDGVAAKIGNAYGQNKTYAYDDLEFRSVYERRHALFHKGSFSSFDSRSERLIQLYFFELLRLRLHLPCKRLAEAAISAFGRCT